MATNQTEDSNDDMIDVQIPKELAVEAVGVLEGEVRDAEAVGEVYSTERIMSDLAEALSEPLNDPNNSENTTPGHFIFELHGINGKSSEYDYLFEVGAGNPETGFDHEAHEASTQVMNALQERFDWAENITGVSMGVE